MLGKKREIFKNKKNLLGLKQIVLDSVRLRENDPYEHLWRNASLASVFL